MILVSEQTLEREAKQGVWGRVTLDQLVRKGSQAHPDRLALLDLPGRARFTTGAMQAWSYAELDRRVDALAAFFQAAGLKPDTVVGVQMPQTSDALMCLIALWRAGLIATPLPLGLRQADVVSALVATGARGLITVGEAEGEALGERLRDVAADLFQIRFVFGISGGLPDGLVDLDRILDEADALGAPAEVSRKTNPADHVATITVSGLGDQPTLVARSHNHLIAAGVSVLVEAQLEPAMGFVSLFAPTGLAALATTVVPWLLTGGTLAMGCPDRVASLVAALPDGEPVVVTPASLARRVDLEMTRMGKNGRLISVSHGSNADPDPFPSERMIVDATVLGEVAVVPLRRAARGPALDLPLSTDQAPGAGLNDLRLKGMPRRAGDTGAGAMMVAEIQARGSAVPTGALTVPADRGHAPTADAAGWVSTGFRGQLTSFEPARVRVLDAGDERAQVGRHLVALAALDRMARACPGILDAAAYAVPDPVLGNRIELAVVQSQGGRWTPDAVLRGLTEANIAIPALPTRIVPVTRIPRDDGGLVRRADLAAAAAGAAG